ncbi:hypothetical protein HU200_002424 [Digitaria exilis]|uniref:NB-ARC domain-containing protein n=1 Tax=Digitaria exilis TaxID=1010633 RepID=A0A835KV71_9POAL|nr:hypothetical protein HU200_002424 [Digitaria exilis]
MTEFVVLLTGCRRMFRSPYCSYLYVDNFMFGRQVEKQQVINILLQNNPSTVATVLPIIGGCRVGKKTLVGSICSDDNIQNIDHENFKRVRTLVIIEFVSDVADKEWLHFYSLLVALTGKGSKVIIISRLKKVLAFGSVNPMDHPQLALIGKELATVFQGSLIMLNVYASVLRKNLNIGFWTRVLEIFRVMMHRNLAIFGEHPKNLLEKDGSAVDITEFSLLSLCSTSFQLMLVTSQKDASGDGLPQLSFGDIIAGSMVLPTKFQLVWKSRLPPYTVICAKCTAETPSKHTPSPMKKRLRL